MNRHRDPPDPDERTQLNAALLEAAAETGFWDEHGRPAPWPDDIDDWRPDTGEPITPEPPETAF